MTGHRAKGPFRDEVRYVRRLGRVVKFVYGTGGRFLHSQVLAREEAARVPEGLIRDE